MRRRISVLGVAVDDVLEDEVLADIGAWIASGTPHHLVTVNPEFVMEARHNSAFRQVLADADLATPDGFGLLVAGRLQRTPFRGRVTGVELLNRIAEHAARYGWRLFFLGAAPGVAEQAAGVLTRRYPGLAVAGCYAGTPAPTSEPEIRERIRQARPDVLFVAYGHPAQDLWIARNQPVLQIPVALGVGGAFDYTAGIVPRAPRLMRRLGLEWLYRVARQPQRWRRILTAVPLFLLHIIKDRLHLH